MSGLHLKGTIFAVVLAAAAALGGPSAMALERLEFAIGGSSDTLAERLQNASVLVQNKREGLIRPDEILAAAQADYSRLIGALYAEGRYGGTISITIDGREAASIGPLDAPAQIRVVRVTVRPGRGYLFARAEIDPLAPGTALPDGFAMGMVAESNTIVDAADAARVRWRELGYPLAAISGQAITADHAARAVSAEIAVEPGTKARLGEMRVTGNARTRQKRIREIAGFPKGQVYSPEALDRTAARLRNTGTFSSVAVIESETLSPDGTLDVELALTEQKTRRIGAGIEIGSTEGLTVSAFWLHRNLFKGAERFRIDGEIAGIGGETGGMDYSLGGRFTRPGTFNPDTDFYVLGALEQKNEPDFNSKSAELGVGITRSLRKNLSGDAGVLFNYTSVTDSTGTEEYQQIFFPLTVTWDRRDDTLNATDGFYLTGRIAPFIGVGDSESGTRVTFDARGYETISDSGLTVAARLQVGSILGASLTGLPNDQRFTSGGGGTVRGQEYQSLGVALPGGGSSGGRSFLGASAEMRYAVTDLISVVGFADWGAIGDGSTPGSDFEDHAGAGLGLRFNTGIGPIRLDVATPIKGEDASASSYQLYIGIGQAF
ncbi:MAG: outer membrane protein assembly factor [Rhodobacteraceae bacterium]|nr:outer membrane protein assembly factor [Paracoccaceae bacterium]